MATYDVLSSEKDGCRWWSGVGDALPVAEPLSLPTFAGASVTTEVVRLVASRLSRSTFDHDSLARKSTRLDRPVGGDTAEDAATDAGGNRRE